MAHSTRRFAIALLTAFLVGSAGYAGDGQPPRAFTQQAYLQSHGVDTLRKARAKPAKPTAERAVFNPHAGLRGTDRYIVVLEDAPLTLYRGGVGNLAPTAPDLRKSVRNGVHSRHKTDVRSPEAVGYLAHLARRQEAFRHDAAHVLGHAPDIVRTMRVALNAVVVRATEAQARALTRVPGVRIVERSVLMDPTTDRGPIFIGAPAIWDGSGTGLPGMQGEGIIVGILDTGINGDHPSFAALGGDGYMHENPLGAGNYLGECFDTPELVCNEKLIGRYNFTAGSGGAESSEDEDGHGSHVASTAAGNWVHNVPIIDAEGNPTDFEIGTIHGVAPHANVIAYRVCAPSCPSEDVIAAIDQAIIDGVDVLNKSISSPPGSPWEDTLSLAHLSARAAGISFAISAGNDGPDPGTVAEVNGAPWNGVVAASTHDRNFPFKGLTDLSGGDTPPPVGIEGKGLTGAYTGPIVYAADYDNGDPDPAQCMVPFPPGTWTNGEIVVCDRGTIARVEKCINVRDGGAAGCVLANIDGGSETVDADAHVIPAININAEDGNALKAWLATGTGHTGTIEASGPAFPDPSVADIMGDFSSRGPYTGFDWLAPNITMPGVAIYAAYASPIEYAFVQGTSMASPHAAGSMALLRQVRPDWTDAEILSALMTTGTQDLLKEDAATPADPFDYGGGRVQVDQAVNAGLVLDETAANFEAADPAQGGDPKTLNIGSMLNDACLVTCSWERTVRATVNNTWTASTDGAFNLTVEPETFSLAAGETQTLTITADVSGTTGEAFIFGEVTLTPAGGKGALPTPPTVMQVAVVPSTGDLPNQVDIEAKRDAGSHLVEDLTALEITNLQVTPYGLSKGDTVVLSITGETGEFSPYDQPDGVGITFFDVPDDTERFVVRTFDSEAPDADLFVGRDDNGDGDISPDEERCNSGQSGSDEFCEIDEPEPGSYWVAVINFTATEPDATDDTSVQAVSVTPTTGNFSAEGPGGGVPPLEPFDLRIFWDLEDAEVGDVYYGNLLLGSDVGLVDDIGNIPVTLVRGEDDVAFTVDSTVADPGDTLTFTVSVAPNTTNEDRAYDIEATVPAGFEFVEGSLNASTGEADFDGGIVTWSLVQPSLAGQEPAYAQSSSDDDPSCTMPDLGQGSGYIDLEEFGIPPTDLAGDTFTASAFSSQNIDFYGEPRTGLNFTDDGFGFFESTPGSQPWVNEAIPNPSDPNDLTAFFWRDFEIVADPTPGGMRGITLATAGPDLSIIEYDDVEPYPAGETTDRIDFEMLIWGFADDTPGAYEIVYAYDNRNGYEDEIGTIGVENQDGTAGTQYAYDDTVPDDGLVVCYDLVSADDDPATLTYQVEVTIDAAGTSVTSEETSVVDDPGSEPVTESVTVEVNDAVDTDGDGVFDFEDNCSAFANPSQCDSDGDLYGNHCDGDFDDGGFVNYGDLAQFKQGFLGPSEPPAYSELDLDCDGLINMTDLGRFKAVFGQPPGPSGLAD
jgi:uncharacterized repeat protein (TIGR01451 family)